MQGTRLSFRTKEDAIHFAEKQGSLYPFPAECYLLTASTGWDYYMYATSLLLPSLLWDSHHSPTVLRPRSPVFLQRIMRRTSCTNLPSSVFSVRSSFNTLLSLRNSSQPLLHNEVREVIAVWIE